VYVLRRPGGADGPSQWPREGPRAAEVFWGLDTPVFALCSAVRAAVAGSGHIRAPQRPGPRATTTPRAAPRTPKPPHLCATARCRPTCPPPPTVRPPSCDALRRRFTSDDEGGPLLELSASRPASCRQSETGTPRLEGAPPDGLASAASMPGSLHS
jgi:hypothetical protein